MAKGTKRAIHAAAVLVAVLAMPACATSDEPAEFANGAQATAASPAPPPPAEAVPACRNDDVSFSVTYQPGGADGTARGLVAVTNESDDACRVAGRATVSLVDAAGKVVQVPTEEVEQPGPSVPATLEPGTSAFEGIKWVLCDKGSATCPAGNSLRAGLRSGADAPAATLSGFPGAEASAITMKSLEVGTLQPVQQGVVAW